MTMTTIAKVIHNGTYTIASPKGGWRTFKISTQKADAKFAPNERIISLLTGADNTRDYTGFGFVKPDGQILIWRSKQTEAFQTLAKMMMQFLRQGDDCQLSRMGYEIKVSRCCRRCNRKLTTPESIDAGIGPECAGKM
jgi:hypothetical protein